jgi:hypothetical protein
MSASSSRSNSWRRQVTAVFTFVSLVVALFSGPAAAVDINYYDCKFCSVFPCSCQHLCLRVATAIASAIAMHISTHVQELECTRISVQVKASNPTSLICTKHGVCHAAGLALMSLPSYENYVDGYTSSDCSSGLDCDNLLNTGNVQCDSYGRVEEVYAPPT